MPLSISPVELESDVVLRDGTTVRLRPSGPDDAPMVILIAERDGAFVGISS